MDTRAAQVSDILSGTKQFIIPVFQRNYDWKEKTWDTLWNDIQNISSNQSDNRATTHFIGPFIIIARALPHAITKYLVIDGQQRLITITVILCALRDRAEKIGLKDLAQSIETNYITFLDSTGERLAKIVPRAQDRETLDQIIRGKASSGNDDSLLIQSYRWFAKQIETLTSDSTPMYGTQGTESLQNIYQVITQRLRLVYITLDDYDNPSNVYESLNFKGDKLSDADLIRNYVFMLVTVEEQDRFDNLTWQSFESLFETNGQIEKDQLTDFYYRFLTFKQGYFTRNRLYVQFMKYVGNSPKEADLKNIVGELRRFARFYVNVINCKAEEPELESSFNRFKQLKVDTAIPLVLGLYDRYKSEDESQQLTISEFINMLQAVESFVIRRSILGFRSRGYGLDFAQAVSNINSFNKLADFLVSKGWPNDQEIKKAFIEFPLYHREPIRTRLILEEIERSFGHKEKIKMADLQIEHVMPQTLTLGWRNDLGSNADEVHRKLLHSLGNLTLTGYNPNLKNLEFDRKKEIYTNSNLQLNKYFQKLSLWTNDEIRKRTTHLTDKFLEIWPRPNSNNEKESSIEVDERANQQTRLF